MPPEPGEQPPEITALHCDGETFRAATLDDVAGQRGLVLVFYAFTFNAVATNWWKRYDRRGWADFDGVPVVGVCRDGPYAQNAFLRELSSPFTSLSDPDGDAVEAFDLLVERSGMAGTHTAKRAVYVLDDSLEVRDRWVLDDFISPVPADEVEDAVEGLA